jgi:hypothetical protein
MKEITELQSTLKMNDLFVFFVKVLLGKDLV